MITYAVTNGILFHICFIVLATFPCTPAISNLRKVNLIKYNEIGWNIFSNFITSIYANCDFCTWLFSISLWKSFLFSFQVVKKKAEKAKGKAKTSSKADTSKGKGKEKEKKEKKKKKWFENYLTFTFCTAFSAFSMHDVYKWRFFQKLPLMTQWFSILLSESTFESSFRYILMKWKGVSLAPK